MGTQGTLFVKFYSRQVPNKIDFKRNIPIAMYRVRDKDIVLYETGKEDYEEIVQYVANYENRFTYLQHKDKKIGFKFSWVTDRKYESILIFDLTLEKFPIDKILERLNR